MIDFPLEKLAALCQEQNIVLDEHALERFNVYANMLVEWNEKMNLTAIVEPEAVVIKHFYDCLLFFKANQIKPNAKIIDVGTGAGFPGLVLLIARPDIRLTLLDSLNKRLVFLSEVLKEIGLEAEIVHSRAEDGGKNSLYREKFDIACARAVARLNVLSEYCLPYVKPGGSFVALKGPAAEDEITAAKKAATILGGGTPEVFATALPDGEQRNIVTVKKISQTPTKYPRISAKIAKQPL